MVVQGCGRLGTFEKSCRGLAHVGLLASDELFYANRFSKGISTFQEAMSRAATLFKLLCLTISREVCQSLPSSELCWEIPS